MPEPGSEALWHGSRVKPGMTPWFDGQSRSEENAMTDAQMGLVVATPAIIVMALLLYRMGVLQKGGVATAILMSLAIAAVLFLEQ